MNTICAVIVLGGAQAGDIVTPFAEFVSTMQINLIIIGSAQIDIVCRSG